MVGGGGIRNFKVGFWSPRAALSNGTLPTSIPPLVPTFYPLLPPGYPFPFRLEAVRLTIKLCQQPPTGYTSLLDPGSVISGREKPSSKAVDRTTESLYRVRLISKRGSKPCLTALTVLTAFSQLLTHLV